MKNRYLLIGLVAVALLLVAADVPEKVVEKSFTGVKALELKLASSDCVITQGRGPEVKVRVEYTYPPDGYEPRFEQSGDRLLLNEEFSHTWFGSLHGDCTWIVEAPAKTQIDLWLASGDTEVEGDFVLSSLKSASGDVSLKKVSCQGKIGLASGDLSIEDAAGEIVVTVASGDVNVRRLAGGMVAIKAVSGDVELEEFRGGFEVSLVSGDLHMRDVAVEKPSVAKSVSGDIVVKLAKSVAADLSLKTASGDIVLDFDGLPLKGTFDLMVQKDNGEIECEVPFDKVEEVMESGHLYIKKSFTRGSPTPHIVIKAHSGNVELRGK